jgi:hypothetical protein
MSKQQKQHRKSNEYNRLKAEAFQIRARSAPGAQKKSQQGMLLPKNRQT